MWNEVITQTGIKLGLHKDETLIEYMNGCWLQCNDSRIMYEQWRRSCEGPGVLTPSLSGSVGSKCARTPHFLVPCCSRWLVIHSISSADSGMHADFCVSGSTLNINVNFINLFDCINCIKMFGSGWTGSAQTHAESTRGKKNSGLTEGERWPQAWTPKI